MKKLTIQFADSTIEARSEANMWTHLRDIRDHQVGFKVEDGETQKECLDHAIVTTEDGTLFKDIVFRLNSKGKVEMVNLVKETCRRQVEKVNLVKETCRRQVEKARKAAKEKAEKEAARKAKKREVDRRYRARKKAEAEALKATTEENTAVEANLLQEA